MSKLSTSLDGSKKITLTSLNHIYAIIVAFFAIASFLLIYEWHKVSLCYQELESVKLEYQSYLSTLKNIIDNQGEDDLDELEKKNPFG